ncbi:NAD-binding protein [Mycobacterium sp. 1245111.1]|uniref:NAD-binding protein n=1 Tax=Mycobacterium sp. 1245111.1 TaxID=1834073 RepID=UPI0009F3CC07|nr:NAD-binding protein [Mycobacterium sp. 1245111.1]
MQHHIIVSGEDALATTIIEELERAGAHVVKLGGGDLTTMCDVLENANISDALAVVCAGDDDAANLEIALLARRSNPSVRVVARLANDVLRAAVAADNGPGAILDVAELTAPSVVEACLAHRTHPFEAAGTQFLVSGSEAPRAATLREIYGDLAPVAVIHGENSSSPGEIDVCPTRNQRVLAGDRAVMIGTADESAVRGIKVRRPVGTRSQRAAARRLLDGVKAVVNDFNPAFYPALAAAMTLVVISMLLLRFNYQHPRMSWVDALYFTIETITTTGYGDFSFAHQETWLRLFAAMLMFGGATTIALLVAFIADVLLSRRFVFAAARPRVRHLRNHVIVVGLSALGMRVVTDLLKAGYDVAVIEINEDNRYLSAARALDVPVIFGDATLVQTLQAARVDRARAVAVLTRDDMINIETGIVLAEMLGPRVVPEVNRRAEVSVVLRVYDRALGLAVAQRFGFENVRSSVALAAPWFIGAAMGVEVLGTFSIGQSSFMVGAMLVAEGSELDGLRMGSLSTKTRVIAICREDAPIDLRPHHEGRLRGGDTVYLVGPYRELVATLRKGLPPRHAATDGDAEPSPQVDGVPAQQQDVEVSRQARTG